MSQDKPSKQPNKLIHWADFAADRIIRQNGDKESYTLASGITPEWGCSFWKLQRNNNG